MKIMKKSLSIVLSILMLASVCTVLMTSSVSAYSYTDKTPLVAHDFEGTELRKAHSGDICQFHIKDTIFVV